MNDTELEKFKNIIGKWKTINIREKTLVNQLTNFIPLETLKDNPLRWQDIWIYNYILYYMICQGRRSSLGNMQRK